MPIPMELIILETPEILVPEVKPVIPDSVMTENTNFSQGMVLPGGPVSSENPVKEETKNIPNPEQVFVFDE